MAPTVQRRRRSAAAPAVGRRAAAPAWRRRHRRRRVSAGTARRSSPVRLVLERVGLDTSGRRRSGQRRTLLLDRGDPRRRDRVERPRPLRELHRRRRRAGRRAPSAAAGAASGGDRAARHAPARPGRSRRQIASRDSKPRSAPSARASSVAITQAAQATPGGTTFAASRDDPAFDVRRRPARSPSPATGSTTSREHRGRVSVRGDGARGSDPLERRLGKVAVGKVGERVGAEQDERRRARPRRRPRASRPCPSPRVGRNRSPLILEPRSARRRGRRAREEDPGRGPCRARRARSPAAAPERKRAPGQRRGEHRRGRGDRRLRTRRARAARGRRRRRRRRRAAPCRARAVRISSTSVIARRRRAHARELRRPRRAGTETEVATGLSAVGTGEQSMIRRPSLSAASRSRRNSTGSSSRRSPDEDDHDPSAPTRRRSSPAAGRATSSAGRPSPSWASTESVPMTPLASLDPGVGVLVREPRAADDADRCRARSPRAPGATPAATAAERLVPGGRLEAVARRGRAARPSAPGRRRPPRSRSGPCRTASSGSPGRESTPR